MTDSERSTTGGISRFSLNRRITVLVLFLTVLVVGVVSALRIPIELVPRGYDDPFLWVNVPWSDAPAREVLDKLTIPLEEELNTVRGIKRIVSVSRTGRSMTFMPFKQGTDMDVAYREVRDRVERARARFPDDVDKVYINKDDASGIPVFVLGVAVDPGVADSYDLFENEIILPLERVDGVASVETDGLVEKEILIELDREKTHAAGLNIYDLAQDLGSDNFTLASGNVRDGDRKLLLRSVARFPDLETLENRKVAQAVRLKDIAEVRYEQPEQDFRVRAMSKPAVAVVVLKEGDANVREVSERVAATAERIGNNPRLGDFEMVTLFSQGEVIDEALVTLIQSGMIGGVLACMVLFLFLRRFRLTIIIALGIPLSLLIGLTTMYFAGESLNLLTLLGLMICVGLLVDNSVVVAENIHRMYRNGLDRRDACIRGAGEVGLAITMSTLTTIVVFLPVALVEGPGQFFLLRLALPICVSVAASLVVALVFIPLCVYLTLGDRDAAAEPSRIRRFKAAVEGVLRRVYEASFGALNRAYGRMLGAFLTRRLDLVLGVVAIFAVTIAVPIQQTKFVDVQDEERNGVRVDVEMPHSTTLEEAEAWFLEAEKVIEENSEEWDVEGWFLFHRKNRGELQCWFNRPRKKPGLTPNEVTQLVKDALPKKPGFEFSFGNEQQVAVEDQGQAFFAVRINGEDADQLETVKDQLEELMVQVPGVLGLKAEAESEPNELGLVIDRQRAQRYQVDPRTIAGVVGYALRGTPLPKYHRDGKEIPVRVRFEEEDRESLSELTDFMVPTAQGDFLPLSSLTDSSFLPQSTRIVRRDSKVGRTITVELEEEQAEATRERLGLLVAGVDLPEGITFGATGSGDSFNEDVQGMLFALALSIIFIYLLMGFLFESFALPLSIILTIPLSIIGVYWIHFVAGYDIDFLGIVAGVLLVGVVVNNGIVLIDYVNRLRREGHARREAILTATSHRFRPIMMTAITTIGGMVPLALAGSNSIGLSYTSFSLTLIGGMSTATLLTLLVVPVFYTLFDDARTQLMAVVRRVFFGSVAPEATASAALAHSVAPQLPRK